MVTLVVTNEMLTEETAIRQHYLSLPTSTIQVLKKYSMINTQFHITSHCWNAVTSCNKM